MREQEWLTVLLSEDDGRVVAEDGDGNLYYLEFPAEYAPHPLEAVEKTGALELAALPLEEQRDILLAVLSIMSESVSVLLWDADRAAEEKEET